MKYTGPKAKPVDLLFKAPGEHRYCARKKFF